VLFLCIHVDEIVLDNEYTLNETHIYNDTFGLYPEDLHHVYESDRVVEQLHFQPTPLDRIVSIFVPQNHAGLSRSNDDYCSY
jgi:hypothetical protein